MCFEFEYLYWTRLEEEARRRKEEEQRHQAELAVKPAPQPEQQEAVPV